MFLTKGASRFRQVSCPELEENTMLKKDIVFVIFGPKCIFDASKNSN